MVPAPFFLKQIRAKEEHQYVNVVLFDKLVDSSFCLAFINVYLNPLPALLLDCGIFGGGRLVIASGGQHFMTSRKSSTPIPEEAPVMRNVCANIFDAITPSRDLKIVDNIVETHRTKDS
ncbi:hypothetical protein MKX08_000364 [Trichoderma sp. CBMAI-0020]|nr:hypothetical protein MKX08_000364 [Trichoderma sp. CBMAI-0020]